MQRLIGLYSPAAQSGKSTVATALQRRLGMRIVSFAGPLKRMVDTLLDAAGLPPDEIYERVYGSRKEEPIPQLNGVSSRFLQQTIGTEWGRHAVSKDFWLLTTRAAVEKTRADGHPVVIDDVRFPNEFDMIREMGGKLIRIHRPSALEAPVNPAYESLLEGNTFDAVIENTGTMAELQRGAVATVLGFG